MADVDITVTGTPPNGTYSSSSPQVSNGTITVNPGTTTIQFTRGAGQPWSFESPWFTVTPAGAFTIQSQDADQITVSDEDPGGGQDRTFEYTLYTTGGNFDPEIINKGG